MKLTEHENQSINPHLRDYYKSINGRENKYCALPNSIHTQKIQRVNAKTGLAALDKVKGSNKFYEREDVLESLEIIIG